MSRFEIHGLQVDSELPIAALPGNRALPAAVRVVQGPRDTGTPVVGDPVAGAGGSYSIWRTGSDFLLRFSGIADFVVSGSRVEVRLEEGADAGIASLLLSGNALALVLMARQELVLHAAAVETRGGAVAFVGSSGAGKSTSAGLVCSTGCPLVTDDVLRVIPDAAGAVCFRGSPELRLRPGARRLAELLAGWDARESVDGRLVMRHPTMTALSSLPLRALLIARWDTDCAERGPSVERVRGANAVLELVRHPRLLGWRDPTVTARVTRQLAALARSVPVFRWRLQPDMIAADCAARVREVVDSL